VHGRCRYIDGGLILKLCALRKTVKERRIDERRREREREKEREKRKEIERKRRKEEREERRCIAQDAKEG